MDTTEKDLLKRADSIKRNIKGNDLDIIKSEYFLYSGKKKMVRRMDKQVSK